MSRQDRSQRGKKFVENFKSQEGKVEVIPSREDIYGREEERQELVGAYCRVSTMSEAQVESYELQKAYYEELVSRRPNWTLVDIYPDEGISATSMRNRKSFLRMIEDCKQGKLTLIITKSVSRFARNVVDGISVVRMLRNLPTPVAVYFETEHINSMSQGADAQLSLLASFAESESLNKSTSQKWAIRSRFAHGIPRIVDLYGFDRKKTQLTPLNNDYSIEPNVIRWMYHMILRGRSMADIRRALHRHHVPSPQGMEWWSLTTIYYILSNEKYAGDVLMQKTVRVDMFTHRSVKNRGQERQYKLREHHDPIVPQEEWVEVQRILGAGNIELYLAEESVEMGFAPGVSFSPILPGV